MSETNSPNAHFEKQASGSSKLGKEVRRTSSKGGLKSQTGTGRSSGTGANTEVGQQYFKQYFQQKKHSNYV